MGVWFTVVTKQGFHFCHLGYKYLFLADGVLLSEEGNKIPEGRRE